LCLVVTLFFLTYHFSFIRPSLNLHSFERLGNKICEMETNARVCANPSMMTNLPMKEKKRQQTTMKEIWR